METRKKSHRNSDGALEYTEVIKIGKKSAMQ